MSSKGIVTVSHQCGKDISIEIARYWLGLTDNARESLPGQCLVPWDI